MKRAEPLCFLRDCTLPFHSGVGEALPPVPGPAYSVQEVVDYLQAAAARPPHMVRLDLPGRVRVWLAIGGPARRGRPSPPDRPRSKQR